MTIRKISYFVLIYGIAIWMQTFFLLNHDVSWCIHAASRLLGGGTYMKDFFDINPPLALYLYSPVVILSAFFHIGIMYALPMYVFILAFLSLYVCALFVEIRFSEYHPYFSHIFLITLGLLFLILPLSDFGQREHLLIILIMPYLIVTIDRLKNHTIPVLYGIGIGTVAFIGFVLKPYFLASFIFIELYYIYQTKNKWFHLRTETLTIIVALFLYIISLFLFHTNYLHVIVPHSLKYYYLGFHDPLMPVLLDPIVLFTLALSIFFFCYCNTKYKHECFVFLLGMWGFLIAYFLQKTVWVYHYFPVLCMGVLLGLFQLKGFITLQKNKSHYLFSLLLVFMVFGYPLFYLVKYFQYGVLYKKTHIPLIEYMNAHVRHRSIYVFTSRIHHIFPAVDYADARFVSRFPHFSLLPGMIYKGLAYHDHLPYDLREDQDQFIEMVTDDLQTIKPDFIFVDVQRYNSYLPDYLSFDYIHYFSKNDEFKDIWKQYHKIGYTDLPTVFPIQEESTNLYVVPTFDAIHLSDVSKVSVILVGRGLHRTVYYTEDSKFELWKDQIISIPFDLTKDEEAFLETQKGSLISKNEPYIKLINQLIARALVAGSPRIYAFEVYEREHT